MLDGISTSAGWSAYEMLLLRVPQLVHPSNVAVRRAESSYHLDLMGLGKLCYQEATQSRGCVVAPFGEALAELGYGVLILLSLARKRDAYILRHSHWMMGSTSTPLQELLSPQTCELTPRPTSRGSCHRTSYCIATITGFSSFYNPQPLLFRFCST